MSIEMQLGKVTGKVIATRKEGNVDGLKILVVNYLNENLEDSGKNAACIDTVNAGEGDVVLLCSSSSARMTDMTRNVCTDNTIVGVVDTVSSNGKDIYNLSLMPEI